MTAPIRTARQLRQEMTAVEALLWKRLRGRQLKNYKFRRQHPIIYEYSVNRNYFYVADFYCASKKLVIEIDGLYHELADQKEYDMARDRTLSALNIKLLRLKNDEVRKNTTGVLNKIIDILDSIP